MDRMGFYDDMAGSLSWEPVFGGSPYGGFDPVVGPATSMRFDPVSSLGSSDRFDPVGASMAFGNAFQPVSRSSFAPGGSGSFGSTFVPVASGDVFGNMFSPMGAGNQPFRPWSPPAAPPPWANGGSAGGTGTLDTASRPWVAQAAPMIQASAAKWGVPPSVIAAMLNRESSGLWETNGNNGQPRPLRGEYILPYIGVFKSVAESWGINWDSLIGNQAAQIDAMAQILSQLKVENELPTWGDVAAFYFAGEENYRNPNWKDEFGMTVGEYKAKAEAEFAMFGTIGQQGAPGAGSGAVGAAAAIIQAGQQYVGKVPYVWGGIPGKGETPTGWDCSGFIYWLDQNYGGGAIPQGSHYQFDWAQKSGMLFTDASQLQPGDLVFFDTGNTAGAGANLNKAGHVGIYLGNGKIMHAANPESGTIISDWNGYYGDRFIGAARPWGGAAGMVGANPPPSGGYQNPNTGYTYRPPTYSLSDVPWGTPNRY